MGGFFWRNFFGGFFGDYLFGMIYLGGFVWEDYWEEFFVYIGIDSFVKILSKSRRKKEGGQNLDP